MGFYEEVLARNPLMCVPLGPLQGSSGAYFYADITGNNRYFTINSANANATLLPGIANTSMGHYDSSSVLSRAHESWMDISAFTVMVIHQPTSLSNDGSIMAIDHGGSPGDLQWRVVRQGTGLVAFTGYDIYGGPGGAVVTAGSLSAAAGFVVGVPTMVGYSVGAAGQKLYVNGALAGSNGSNAAPTAKTGLLRVMNLNTPYPAYGWFEAFAMFGSQLPDSDHVAFYQEAAALLRPRRPRRYDAAVRRAAFY